MVGPLLLLVTLLVSELQDLIVVELEELVPEVLHGGGLVLLHGARLDAALFDLLHADHLHLQGSLDLVLDHVHHLQLGPNQTQS